MVVDARFLFLVLDCCWVSVEVTPRIEAGRCRSRCRGWMAELELERGVVEHERS